MPLHASVLFLRPSGADPFTSSHPRLTPWAAFSRRFAAGHTRCSIFWRASRALGHVQLFFLSADDKLEVCASYGYTGSVCGVGGGEVPACVGGGIAFASGGG